MDTLIEYKKGWYCDLKYCYEIVFSIENKEFGISLPNVFIWLTEKICPNIEETEKKILQYIHTHKNRSSRSETQMHYSFKED